MLNERPMTYRRQQLYIELVRKRQFVELHTDPGCFEFVLGPFDREIDIGIRSGRSFCTRTEKNDSCHGRIVSENLAEHLKLVFSQTGSFQDS